jgi:hypothetical protein
MNKYVFFIMFFNLKNSYFKQKKTLYIHPIKYDCITIVDVESGSNQVLYYWSDCSLD